MANSRYRSKSAVFTGLLGAAVVLAGCSATPETVTSGGTGGTAGQTAPADGQGSLPSTAPPHAPNPNVQTTVTANGPPTTHPDPNTSFPSGPVTVPTIPASGEDPAMIDCGTLYRAAGWPTTFMMNRASFSCLADAFVAGTPARLVDREQTDGEGGAILVTTYDVLAPGRARVTVDAREAADRPQEVMTSECTALTAEPDSVIVSGCTVVSS